MKTADLGLLTSAGQPTVSPNGQHIAFTVTRVDLDDNGYRTQIWVAAADGSRAPRPLTDGVKGDANPTWSPDGRLLAFTSHRAEKATTATIHVLPFDGPGEIVTIAAAKGGASELTWSPDGRWVAYTSDALDPRYDEDDPAKQPPRLITRFFSRLDSKGWTHDRPSHLFVVRADGGGLPRDLTPGEFVFGSPSWLADSSGVIGTGAAHETWDLDFATDLYLVPLAGERRALTSQDGIYTFPTVSPDGRRVAFLGQTDASLGAQSTRVGVLDLGSGEHHWVDGSLDRTFMPFPGAQPPVWDDDSLLASYEDRGDVLVRRIPVDSVGVASEEPATTVTGGQRGVSGFSYAAGTLAVTVSRFDRPGELAVVDPDGTERLLTSLADEFVATVTPLDAHRFTSPSTTASRSTRGSRSPPASIPLTPPPAFPCCSTSTADRSPSTATASSTRPRSRREPDTSSSCATPVARPDARSRGASRSSAPNT